MFETAGMRAGWPAVVVRTLLGVCVGICAQSAAGKQPPSGRSSALTGAAPRSLERLPDVHPRSQVPGILPGQPKSGRRFAVVRASATQPVNDQELRAPMEPIPPGPEAASGVGMTLEDLTQTAMSNSPIVRGAQARAIAARGRAFQASRYPNPTFGTASPQLAGNQSQYNAYLIQDLVTKGKIRLDTAAAERAAAEADLALVRARFDVLTTVRQRFYTALATQKRVELLEAMVKIARTSHEVSERLWKADIGARGDVLLLQIELSKAEAELKNANYLAETSRMQLAAATGLFELQIVRVEADLTEALPDYELLAVQHGVISRNALAQIAQVEIARSQYVLQRAVVEPFPNLNMLGGWQNQQPGALAPENQGLYQVQMVVPLWNRNQGNIRAAQAEVGAAVAQLTRVRNDLANNAAAVLGRYLTARQLVERYEKEIVPSAVELQNISSKLYMEGQSDFLRYLAAQRALLDANLAYINAQEDRWTSAADVAGLLQSDQFP